MERAILLVDDEENILAALARVLRRDGYRILKAGSGREGLELLALNNDIGVIITDQRMPDMTGTEFLSKVKELYPETIRIVLSGYTELNSVTDAINRGAVYKFLTKPWEDDLLRANVEEAFQRHEMKVKNAELSQQLKQANEELLRANSGLERHVEEKTADLMRNIAILQIAQDTLEYLPVAVIGIGDDGMVASANRMAHRLFAAGDRTLMGEPARDVIPLQLPDKIFEGRCVKPEEEFFCLDGGNKYNCWCHSMKGASGSTGVVLVVLPV